MPMNMITDWMYKSIQPGMGSGDQGAEKQHQQQGYGNRCIDQLYIFVVFATPKRPVGL